MSAQTPTVPGSAATESPVDQQVAADAVQPPALAKPAQRLGVRIEAFSVDP